MIEIGGLEYPLLRQIRGGDRLNRDRYRLLILRAARGGHHHLLQPRSLPLASVGARCDATTQRTQHRQRAHTDDRCFHRKSPPVFVVSFRAPTMLSALSVATSFYFA